MANVVVLGVLSNPSDDSRTRHIVEVVVLATSAVVVVRGLGGSSCSRTCSTWYTVRSRACPVDVQGHREELVESKVSVVSSGTRFDGELDELDSLQGCRGTRGLRTRRSRSCDNS